MIAGAEPAVTMERMCLDERFKEPQSWDDFRVYARCRSNRPPGALAAIDWAFDRLEAVFNDEWLEEARNSDDPPSLLETLIWLNGHDDALFTVLDWACKLAEFERLDGGGKWRRDLRRNVRHHRVIHSALQGTLAGSALRLGWSAELEPLGIDGKSPGDVVIETGQDRLAVETRVVQMSARMKRAHAKADEVMDRVQLASFGNDVHVEGRFARIPGSLELQLIENWVQTWRPAGISSPHWQRDGIDLHIGPRDEVRGGLSGPPVGGETWRRVLGSLREKTLKAEASGVEWLCFEPRTGMWGTTLWAQLPLARKLQTVVHEIEAAFGPDRTVGIVLVSALSTAYGYVEEETAHHGNATMLRRFVPPFHGREAIIVPATVEQTRQVQAWIDLFEAQSGWVNWALDRQGIRPFAELIAL